MLFNSYTFIVGFLPIVILLFHVVSKRWGRSAGLVLLTTASLVFYGWWNPPYLLLILASILGNFCLGEFQKRTICYSGRGSRVILATGIITNISVLGYYKYMYFLASAVLPYVGVQMELESTPLPLAISFFTFTQIAYQVDIYYNKISRCSIMDYGFFVLFFPHLIAGPIVRHHEILPQLPNVERRILPQNIAVGLTVFLFGLFKKVLLADTLAPLGNAVFNAAAAGEAPNLILAWGGALAYTLQLYFDFSGYSDMAIGLGFLFGVRLPINFNSPYKARSVVDFWRRWHISLSRFLKDYLYIPLGGNRCGNVRTYFNLIVTMVIGGIWHGAGWMFVFWGALHGALLLINHAWRHLSAGLRWARIRAMQPVYQLLTFLSVIVGWVFFRSSSMDAAVRILRGMVGLNDIIVPSGIAKWLSIFQEFSAGPSGLGARNALWIMLLLGLCFFAPNTQQIMHNEQPGLNAETTQSFVMWRATPGWALVCGIAASMALLSIGKVSEFLYYQF